MIKENLAWNIKWKLNWIILFKKIQNNFMKIMEQIYVILDINLIYLKIILKKNNYF